MRALRALSVGMLRVAGVLGLLLVSVSSQAAQFVNVNFSTYLGLTQTDTVTHQTDDTDEDTNWTLVAADDDSYHLLNARTSSYLHFSSNSAITLSATTSERTQWRLVPSSALDTYRIESVYSNRNLDADTNNGIDTSSNTQGDKQWILKEVLALPVALDDAIEVEQSSADNVIVVLGNDILNGAVISDVSQGSAGGTVSVVGETLVYSPAADFFGTETFSYTLNNAVGSDTATVSVVVQAPVIGTGGVPTAHLVNVSFSTHLGLTQTDTVTHQADDTDEDTNWAFVAADGDSYHLLNARTSSYLHFSSNSAITLSATTSERTQWRLVPVLGSDTYLLQSAYSNRNLDADTNNGIDTSSNAEGDKQWILLVPPVALDDAIEVEENSTDNVIVVLGNDTLNEAVISDVSQGSAGGTASVTDETLVYSPAAGFFGTESFSYTLNNAAGSDTATVSVLVNEVPVTAPPVALDDAADVEQNSTDNVIVVLGNDTLNEAVISDVSQGSAGGTVSVVGATLVYRPAVDFFGSETFSYTLSNAIGSDTATVSAVVRQQVVGMPDLLPQVSNDSDGDGIDDQFDAYPGDGSRWTDSTVGELDGSLTVTSSGEATYKIPLILPPGTGGIVPSLSLEYDRNAARGLIGEGWCVVGLGLSIGDEKDDTEEASSPERNRVDGASQSPGTSGDASLARTDAFGSSVVGGSGGNSDQAASVYEPDEGISEFGKTNVADDARIMRCEKTLADDGAYRQVQFDGQDKFCLNGDRPLIAIAGDYGADGTEYRIELDEFTRVISYGAAGQGPAYFMAWNKHGEVYEFGNSVDSRIEAQNKPEVAVWAVNKVSDRNGNYYSVHYNEDNAQGAYWVSQIRYTGNEAAGLQPYQTIDFSYEARPDVIESFQGGARYSLTHRLTKITTSALEYRFAYMPMRYDWEMSRVARIEQCDHNGLCVGATEIAWGEEDRGWVYDENAAHVRPEGDDIEYTVVSKHDDRNHGVRFSDLNGDGLVDIIKARHNERRRVYINTGKHFIRDYGWADNIPNISFRDRDERAEDRGLRIQDLNGDGLPDLIRLRDDDSRRVMLNNGSEFVSAPSWAETIPSNVNFVGDGEYGDDLGLRLTDLNGDGLMDLFRLWHGGPVRVLLNTGSGFERDRDWEATIGNSSRPYVFFTGSRDKPAHEDHGTRLSDLNGDGLPDVITLRHTNSHRVYLNTGSGFVRDRDWEATIPNNVHFTFANDQGSNLGLRLTDLNNDNLPDLLRLWEKFPRTVLINTGSGFVRDRAWGDSIPDDVNFNDDDETAEDRGTRIVDLNGDGYPDLLRLRDKHAKEAYINTGDRFVLAREWTAALHKDVDFAADNDNGTDEGTRIQDLNGDGYPDLIALRWKEKRRVYMNTGSRFVEATDTHFNFLRTEATSGPNGERHDAIKRITTGLGEVTELEYDYLVNSAVYSRGSEAEYPDKDVTMPGVPVVSQVKMSDGLGGLYSMTYQYVGMRENQHGRGVLGFAQQRITDERSGISTVADYRQDFPHIGDVITQKTVQADGKVLSRLETEYASLERHPGVFWPHAVSRISWQCALEAPCTAGQEASQYLIRTQASAEYDDFGNSTQVSTVMDDGNGGNVWQRTASDQFQNNASDWLIGLRTRSSEQRSFNGVDAGTRTVSYAYDAVTGLLRETVRQPGAGSGLEQVMTYARDVFGNVVSETRATSGSAPRTSTMVYDAQGRFRLASTNLLGHTSQSDYEPNFGNMLSSTNANGLVTSYDYDSLGMRTKQTNSDGTAQVSAVLRCAGCTINGVDVAYVSASQASGSAVSASYANVLGDTLRTYQESFDGTPVYADTIYDNRQRVVRQSRPYYVGETVYQARYTYDNFSRLLHQEVDNAFGGTYNADVRYAGLSTTTTNDQGVDSIVERDLRNRTQRTVHGANTSVASAIQFSYDGWDQQLSSVDEHGNVWQQAFDVLGRVIEVNDPDLGVWTHELNGFDELTRQVDAKGQVVTLERDVLGRLTRRVKEDGIDTWVWDSAPGKGIGQMHRQVSNNGVSREYAYDDLGRVITHLDQIDGGTYTTQMVYDALSRVDELHYPDTGSGVGDFAVKQRYTSRGALERVERADGSGVIWQAVAKNVYGQPTEVFNGNGVVAHRGYDPATGWLSSIESVNQGGATLQWLTLAQDSLGNLESRSDQLQGFSELFSYDGLYRLTDINVLGGDAGVHEPVSVSYDLIGNITYKSDIGDYGYGDSCNGVTSGPHAVSHVLGAGADAGQYCYDANGNLQSGGGASVAYSSFNKPTAISRNGSSVQWAYGPDHSRVTRDIDGKHTVYVGLGAIGGSLYERTVDSGTGEVKHVHFINTGSGTTAAYTVTVGAQVSEALEYYHRDHLGSVDVVTDDSGAVKHRQQYDAWGKRRADNWQASDDASLPLTEGRRGYTDHEEVPEIGLTHMNGRVYNPALAKFLSADPFIQSPGNSQSYNRYSYVMNNPLKYTDPSGYMFIFSRGGRSRFGGGSKGGGSSGFTAPKHWSEGEDMLPRTKDKRPGYLQASTHEVAWTYGDSHNPGGDPVFGPTGRTTNDRYPEIHEASQSAPVQAAIVQAWTGQEQTGHEQGFFIYQSNENAYANGPRNYVAIPFVPNVEDSSETATGSQHPPEGAPEGYTLFGAAHTHPAPRDWNAEEIANGAIPGFQAYEGYGQLPSGPDVSNAGYREDNYGAGNGIVISEYGLFYYDRNYSKPSRYYPTEDP